MASEKSKILVVGGTGYLGRHVVAASARLGHPTFALVRDTAPPDAARAALLKSFKDAGVTLVKGDLGDQASLVSAPRSGRSRSPTRPGSSTPSRRPATSRGSSRRSSAWTPTARTPWSRPGPRSSPPRRRSAAPPRAPASPTRSCGRATSSATGCQASGRSWPGRPPPTRPSSSAAATPGRPSRTRATSGRTRCWPPTTRARRTGRCTSSRRPTRCRTTSSWRCGRGRPAGRSSGFVSTRTPCSGRSKKLRPR